MYTSNVMQKLRRGETSFGTSLQLIDPAIFELAASLGIDAIWLDLEHHSLSDYQAQELMRSARAGGATDIVIRPGKGEFMRMARLLEAGAHGIMYPRCESAAEAAEVVRWSKFAPIGERGFDGAGADGGYMAHSMVDYIDRANRNTFLIIQVEDERSIAKCDEMIAVAGIDMLMLGPADLSVLSGNAGQFHHPLISEARQRVADAAKAAGKHWAATSMSLEHARQLSEAGASLIFSGADIVFLRRDLCSLRDAFAKLGVGGQAEQTDGGVLSAAQVTCAG